MSLSNHAYTVIATFKLKRLENSLLFIFFLVFSPPSLPSSFLSFFLLSTLCLSNLGQTLVVFTKEQFLQSVAERNLREKDLWCSVPLCKVRLTESLGEVRLQIVMKSRVIESGQVSLSLSLSLFLSGYC